MPAGLVEVVRIRGGNHVVDNAGSSSSGGAAVDNLALSETLKQWYKGGHDAAVCADPYSKSHARRKV